MQNSAFSLDGTQPRATERRQAPRRRVLLQGKLVFPHNSFSTSCSIRDLSDSGARITFADPSIVADPFLIIVRDGSAHESTTMWTRQGQAGLLFVRSHDLGAEVPFHLRSIKRLWLELLPR